MQYCSLQHWTLLPLRHIHNWVLFLPWLRLFILSGIISPLISSSMLGSYWPGEFIIHGPFCLFIPFMGFSRQEYWSGLPFPFLVDHVLSELSIITRPSWVALHDVAPSFIELDKAVVCVIRLVSFLWLWFLFCLPSDGEGEGAYGCFLRGVTERETGSCSYGQGHAQQIFNPVFCCWVGLCSLPAIWPEAKLWWR